MVYMSLWKLFFYDKVYKYFHPDVLLIHPNAKFRNKDWHIFQPNVYVMKYSHVWLEFG